MHLLLSLAATAALTAIYSAWLGVQNPTTVALSFLLIVLVVAAVSHRWVAIWTSLAAFLCFNLFFLPPLGTLAIADPAHWVALFTLLAVSIVASHLSSQARRRTEEATARRDEISRLFDLTRDILLTTDTRGAVDMVAGYIARRFRLDGVSIWLPEAGRWQAHHAGAMPLATEDAALDHLLETAGGGKGSDASPAADAGHAIRRDGQGAPGWLVPLRVGARAIGILGLRGASLAPGARDALAGIAAIAIERTHLLEERKESEMMRRSAELKSALLAALGHDLKTPLTAVTVAADNLTATWLDENGRHEQAEIVRSELARLNRLFDDIIDMARVETHAVDAEPEWVQPGEIVEAAARQVEQALAGHQLHVQNAPAPVLVRVDPRLMSSALAHVLENAAQYSPPGSGIDVDVTVDAGELRLRVRDRGTGLAPEDFDQVFERSYRGAEARRQRFGTGMGLAITRGLLAAQGGRVWAENHPDGGAVFTLVVPVMTQATSLVEGELS